MHFGNTEMDGANRAKQVEQVCGKLEKLWETIHSSQPLYFRFPNKCYQRTQVLHFACKQCFTLFLFEPVVAKHVWSLDKV